MNDLFDDSPRVEVDVEVAAALVATQFPRWSDLPVRAVAHPGWDNRTFRLGERFLLRFPSARRYVAQVEKEQLWLPRLARELPLPVPQPVAQGQPGRGFPWIWSIYEWIQGESADVASVRDRVALAVELGDFLRALRSLPSEDGPAAGEHNFFRGGRLQTYEAETLDALARLSTRSDQGDVDWPSARKVWDRAMQSDWEHDPVWVHGDVSSGNILVERGELAAVIDFGLLGVGDPACDLTIAWTYFEGASRDAFAKTVDLDVATWECARGWALWKALITLRDEEDDFPRPSAARDVLDALLQTESLP